MNPATAAAISRKAHAGQVRKGTGEPYANHPARVARAMPTDDGKVVAHLHDVLEDTAVSLSQLITAGLTEVQADALLAVTRRESQTYSEFIAFIVAEGGALAIDVKIADIVDNLSDLPPELASLKARYTKAITALQAAPKIDYP